MSERQIEYPPGRLSRRHLREVAKDAPIFKPDAAINLNAVAQSASPSVAAVPADVDNLGSAGVRSTPDSGVRRYNEPHIEAEMLAVFDSAITGETIAMAFERREHELRQLFARLTVAESRHFQRRLAMVAPGDTLAARFNGMIAERRERLLAFLGDARRREALGRRPG